MNENMVVVSVLDALIAVSSLTLRYTSILFVRFHPLGRRYLDRIYWSFGIFLFAFITQLFLVRRLSLRLKRNRGLALLLTIFDAARPISTAVSFLVNICCLAAVLDFLFRGHMLHQSNNLSFSRIGFVDSSTARVVIRAPNSDYVDMNIISDSGASSANVDPIFINHESDYTGTFLVEGLAPNTSYMYSTNASHTGSFRTSVSPQDLGRWSLISSSCIKPFYPYSPIDHGLRIKGLEHLSNYVSSKPVEMMLFLGDFIYIDLPIPLGWDAKAYYTAYRQAYASPSWSSQLRAIPWLHVYDDHEIINDWAANETGLYGTAMQPFWSYQGHANPPSAFGAGQTYYVFRRGGVSFFVLDTRRYRSDIALADGPEKTMLGEQQCTALVQWLESETDYKVVVSSVPFTRNWRGPDSADSWSGYLWEREQILDAMKRNGGAIILSGDRHEHATTKFPPNNEGEMPVIEFSTSPLNQFYEPFDRFHKEIEDTDISIHSHPWGTSKFGVVSFDTSNKDRLTLHYDLIVDGSRVWQYDWEVRRKDGE
ncbi:hypothetical protein LCI18_003840 [Fusarium solani-melongenae]|uniref:Uncharacterized protein n=1 Tax=Fusarium solani subsp. cucurbitae TaxID=2747967 RepID=A0ACD3YVI5_FUSSC|nr:hypothetical protein LCI18_003840 [Fusarium solani-melongenae]